MAHVLRGISSLRRLSCSVHAPDFLSACDCTLLLVILHGSVAEASTRPDLLAISRAWYLCLCSTARFPDMPYFYA
jgi:hypothetical protein